ncbi:MAG: hypothetical protein GC159_10240 [Phycisphaera sp.]|nr:hypothetical protein [Phycisphaera sp.]
MNDVKPTGGGFWRKLHWYTVRDHNVFYPASAVSMMAGCFLLSSAMGMKMEPVSLWTVLAMLGVMQVYELLLVGLAIYLLRAKRLWRDGRLLLIAEAIFVVDLAQLNAVIATMNPAIGSIVSVIVMTLAGAKVWAVVKVLKIDVPVTHVACVVTGMAMVLGWPAALARWSDLGGAVTPWTMYGWWWMIAALLAAHGAMRHRAWKWRRWGGLGATVGGWLIAGVYTSLAVHAHGSGWVYHIETQAAYVGPACVALALCVGPVLDGWWTEKSVITAEIALIGAGVLMSLKGPRVLTETVWVDWLTVSPLRLVLLGAVVVLVLLTLRRRIMTYAVCAATCLAMVLTGHSLDTMLATIKRLVPRTQLGWGVVTMSLSFVLLGLGALCSFRNGDTTPGKTTGQ